MRICVLPVLIPALCLAGCGLPRSGASMGEVKTAARAGDVRLVTVSADTIPQAINREVPFSDSLSFAPLPAIDSIGPGDVLHLRIYESGPTAIYATVNGDLGQITVSEAGTIFVPYAGVIQVAGLSMPEARRAVARRLQTVIRAPQVDLRLEEAKSRLVSVQGDAEKAGSYPIQHGRTTLGELLGEVAPNLEQPEMVRVIVRRGVNEGVARFAEILRDRKLDIALQAGDEIILDVLSENITVLGAAGRQGQVPITRRAFSVLDALGAAEGLNEDVADPRAVFLIRPDANGGMPAVYHFKMQNPETIALASRFVVNDKDAILISNSPYARVRKFLRAVSLSLSQSGNTVTVAQ